MQPSQPFRATHTAPATGMATWAAPGDPSPGPRLDPHLPVQVLQNYGDWAQIMCSNGWTAWVDGRILVPVATAAPTSAPYGGVPAPAPYGGAPAPAPYGGAPAPAPGPVGAPGGYGAAVPPPAAAPVAAPPPPSGVQPGLPPVARGYAGAPAARKPYSFITPNADTWPVAAGAALLLIAVFLPWWAPKGGDSQNALDVPFMFLFDKEADDSAFSVGLVVLLLAVGAFVLRHLSGLEKIARVPAALAIPITVMYIVQVNSLVSDAKDQGADIGLFDLLGIGVWPALVGAGLMAWGGRIR